ncbi:MAG: IS5 family transposase [Pirellulales bacterium]
MVHRWHHGPSSPLCDRRRQKGDSEEPLDHALGRSRGGFSTKIHVLCDGHGLPLAFRLTAGQTHESQVLDELLVTADEQLLDDDGERIPWPFALGGDKGYRADWIDEYLLDLGVTPVIPSKQNQDRDARLVDFDREAYRRRNIIERLIGWLKENRRILSRFEKTAKNFGGMITLAFIRQYLSYELV